ncbi:MAG: hypothetical protein V1725_00775 [archaeon]
MIDPINPETALDILDKNLEFVTDRERLLLRAAIDAGYAAGRQESGDISAKLARTREKTKIRTLREIFGPEKDIEYTVNIYFPEWFTGQAATSYESIQEHLVGDKLVLKRNGYLMEAHLKGVDVPSHVENEPDVKSGIFEPAKELMFTEWETIDNELEELRVLVRKKKHCETFYYKRGGASTYRVFEHAHYVNSDNVHLFRHVHDLFVRVPPDCLKERFNEIRLATDYVKVPNNDHTCAYMWGGTLKKATARVLALYNSAEWLLRIQPQEVMTLDP